MTYEFDESEKPTGRARLADIPQYLWTALEHAASTGKGKVVKSGGKPEIDETQVKEWRGMLRRAEVRAAFIVTTEVKKLDNGLYRFSFGAERAPQDPPQADPAKAESSETDAPAVKRK